MTILMTMRVHGDGEKLEKVAADNPGMLQEILEKASERGRISHRFWAHDGDIMVVDEWPSRQAFAEFFEEEKEHIKRVMDFAGVTAEPEITYWRKLDTGDDFG
jgi:heme-degrading monooxygenase HmoA